MRLAYFIFFFLFISCNNDQEWKYLFNGESLDGWEIKIREHKIGENFKNTFKVDNDAIKVSYEEYDEFDKKFDLKNSIVLSTKYQEKKWPKLSKLVGWNCIQRRNFAQKITRVFIYNLHIN